MTEMTKLILIGYWAGPDGEGVWPDPQSMVDVDWDERERMTTYLYLANGMMTRAYMGYSPCRFCGQNNGALELTDGTYVWPEGLGHYVEKHNVRLPEEFVAHVRARRIELGRAQYDADWWSGLAATD